jgi:hypothetical protein
MHHLTNRVIVFLKVYIKANHSAMEVKSIIDALKANVVAHIDQEQHGMLISFLRNKYNVLIRSNSIVN